MESTSEWYLVNMNDPIWKNTRIFSIEFKQFKGSKPKTGVRTLKKNTISNLTKNNKLVYSSKYCSISILVHTTEYECTTKISHFLKHGQNTGLTFIVWLLTLVVAFLHQSWNFDRATFGGKVSGGGFGQFWQTFQLATDALGRWRVYHRLWAGKFRRKRLDFVFKHQVLVTCK